MHSPRLTQQFLDALHETILHYWVYPTKDYPAYSAWHLTQWLQQQIEIEQAHVSISGLSDTSSGALSNKVSAMDERKSHSFTFLGFSAGVVAAIGAAWGWQLSGGRVNALIAIDGWGVPLCAPFPIYRVSHDYVTYWSSSLLGAGTDQFYADPPVDHLDIWRSPHLASGWSVPSNSLLQSLTCPLTAYRSNPIGQRSTAAEFIIDVLKRHQEAVLSNSDTVSPL
jgi:hypothetical protein